MRTVQSEILIDSESLQVRGHGEAEESNITGIARIVTDLNLSETETKETFEIQANTIDRETSGAYMSSAVHPENVDPIF